MSTSLFNAACSYARLKVLVYLGATLLELLVRKPLLLPALRFRRFASLPDTLGMPLSAMYLRLHYYHYDTNWAEARSFRKVDLPIPYF